MADTTGETTSSSAKPTKGAVLTGLGRSEIIAKYKRSDGDTGSAEVQIALLTKRLEVLSDHFKKHPQDKHSRRGLMGVVSRRKRLLQYLRGEDIERYRTLIAELGIRK